MLRACPVWIWERTRPGADRVWGELNSLETYGSARSAFPSIAHLSRACNMGRDAVIGAIKALEAVGALHVKRIDGKSSEYSTFLDPPEDRQVQPETSRESRPVGESEENAGETCWPPRENGGSDQSGIPTRKHMEAREGADAPSARAARDGISLPELFGAWKSGGWSRVSDRPYVVTGPDKAAAKDGAAAFRDVDEAREYFAEVVPWMMNDPFWRDHVSLRNALQLRNRYLVEGLKAPKPKEEPVPTGYRTTADELRRQLQEVDPAAYARLAGSGYATVSTPESAPTNGDGGAAGHTIDR